MTREHRDAGGLNGPLLCIDTAIGRPGFALVGADGAVTVHHEDRAQRAEQLTVRLVSSLNEQGVAASSLRAVVVGIGPGSFTGIRVGMSLGMGLASGASIPVYGASSLLMLAATSCGHVVVALNARDETAYVGRYWVSDDGCSALEPDSVAAMDDVRENIAVNPPDVLISDLAWDRPIVPVEATDPVAGLRARRDDIERGAESELGILSPQYLRLSAPERAEQERSSGNAY